MNTYDQTGNVVQPAAPLDELEEVVVTAKRLPVARVVGVNWNIVALAAALAFISYIVVEDSKPYKPARRR